VKEASASTAFTQPPGEAEETRDAGLLESRPLLLQFNAQSYRISNAGGLGYYENLIIEKTVKIQFLNGYTN
jgi:hypothetical protein